jgi:hypothetical protein
MIPVDNIVFMKENFPQVWDAYRETESQQNPALVEVIPSRVEAFPTLCLYGEDRDTFLHSRYNPLREAQTIVKGHKNVEEYEHVIFYGTGLGYHIRELLERYPHLSFSIYEPVPEVFAAFLAHNELKSLPVRRLHEIMVETSPKDAEAFLHRTIAQIQENILFVDLPSYRTAFADKFQSFLELFKDIVSSRRVSLATDFTFEKRWIINSLRNFKEVLNTPNILAERAGWFKDKPAILVSAGPSLDYEIENLRYIKENGLAYIFSVGSAVNSLINVGIHPHAQCTYDPGAANQKMVFARITEEGIIDIPLIFGSSVGYEVLENYPGGTKLHMITSQDTISSYLLKLDDETRLDGVMDAPSIAVVTLQLLYKLGFNPIILVGQNLAYAGDRHYAGGIEYGKDYRIDPDKTKGLVRVKDVEGNEIYTSPGFDRMRMNMEHYIQSMEGIEVINTTRGGADIKGTTYRLLDELVAENLFSHQVVEPDWYSIPATTYDREYLKKRFTRLKNDYNQLDVQLQGVMSVLKEIKLFQETNNHEQLNRCWPKFDRAFNKVKKNKFFEMVIRPMNRVSYELFFNQISAIRFETDPIRKADMLINGAGKAIYDSMIDVQSVVPIMRDLDKRIG